MLKPSASVDEIVEHLAALRDDAGIQGMARYGIDTSTALGITTPQLKAIARQISSDHARALQLWQTGLRDARMLAIYTCDCTKLTTLQAHAWAGDFNSWEVVDTAAILFVNVPYWRQLVTEFAADDREFVRRCAFAMIACASVHLKKEPDTTFLACLPLIETHATDPRNFVCKAVDWALRSIGKRNQACHGPALLVGKRLCEDIDRTRRRIGRNAVRELQSEAVLRRLR